MEITAKHDPRMPEKHFSVSAYLDRIEQAAIDIEQEKEPVDQTIILWWGLDGMSLNGDGSVKLVSRKKPKSDPIQASSVYSCVTNNTVFWADNQPVFQSMMPQGFSALQPYCTTPSLSMLMQQQQCCICYPTDCRSLCNSFGATGLIGW